MRGLVIINPNAGSFQAGGGLVGELANAGLEVRETGERGDAKRAAKGAADEGFDTVIAAGGDGTVSEVVDGLAAGGGRARLGVLPLGTGNDLARTLALPLDVDGALAELLAGRERVIDLIRVDVEGGPTTYAANVAAGGFSTLVDEELSADAKKRWGPLAYVFSAAKVLPDMGGFRTAIAWDDGDAAAVDAFSVLVANGRSVAGGQVVAPLACLEDGLLDVVVIRSGSLLDLAGVAARLALGNVLDSDAVEMRRARALCVISEPPMRFNADGELLPPGPTTFRVVPGALRVLVGEGYSPGSKGAGQEA